MIHMISSFDLDADENFEAFRAAYDAFISDLTAAGVIADAGPVGRRVEDTPMDTDSERTQKFVSIISFRDRKQLDAAYADIAAGALPEFHSHASVVERVRNSVFLCWEDQTGKEKDIVS